MNCRRTTLTASLKPSSFEETNQAKIFPNAAFGYWKVTVERPCASPAPTRSVCTKPRRPRSSASRAGATLTPRPSSKKVHPAQPAAALFPATVNGKSVVVEYEPDPDQRDTEQIPLLEDGGVAAFLNREVLPYAPDARHNPATVKIGYEISFNHRFYRPQPMRSLDDIRADIMALERESDGLLGAIIGWRSANGMVAGAFEISLEINLDSHLAEWFWIEIHSDAEGEKL